MSDIRYDPDWIPPPGATVQDLISRQSGTPSERAIDGRLGDKRAEMLFRGDLEIDTSLAALLAETVGLTSVFWLERERLYRAALDRRESEKQLLGELPLKDMAARAMIRPVRSHAEKVAEVLSFFGKTIQRVAASILTKCPAR